MKFLGSLGIDLKLLIAQMVNFGLLLWLLTKFLYRPIIRRIERDEAVLRQAEKEKKELERTKEEFDRRKKQEMAETKTRAAEIINEAENIAGEIKNRAEAEAREEKQATVKQIKNILANIEHAQGDKK